jgi:adenylate cyclase
LKRRLAALLIADVVGYSRLMEDDEVATLTALRSRRTSVLDPVVRAHSGRIVKVMGDGVLIEFASAVNAVAAALDLQRGIAEANADTAENRQIIMRIGINLGDVIGEGRDIFGDSVNIAARLETLADPGGICISGKVFDEVERKIDCNFEDMGPQSVKNILRDIRTFRVLPAHSRTKTPAPPDLSLPEKPSIAVLPFQNMSADAEQEYFADGIVEDIITELSRASWLFVIARNSSFTYKGRAVDIKQVGREQGGALCA